MDLSQGVEPIDIAGGDYQGKPNPHAWGSPKNGIIYVQNIVRAFSDIDPAHKDTYQANGEAYIAKLKDIDVTLQKELADLLANHRALVTCEAAFSYLARDAGLTE